MSDEPNIQRMLEYLRTYAGQYDLNILREQLLASGQQPDEVAEAIARFRNETPVTEAVIVAPPAPQPLEVVDIGDNPAEDVQPAAPLKPALPLSDEQIIEQMVDYLQTNSPTYSHDALRAQLLAADQPVHLIDAAFERLQSSSAPATPVSNPPDRRIGWPFGCLAALAHIILIPSLIVISAMFLNAVGVSAGPVLLVGLALLLLIPLIALVGGLIVLRSRPLVGRTLLYAAGFSLVLSVLLVAAAAAFFIPVSRSIIPTP